MPFGYVRTTVLLKMLLSHMWVGIDLYNHLYEGLGVLLDRFIENRSITLQILHDSKIGGRVLCHLQEKLAVVNIFPSFHDDSTEFLRTLCWLLWLAYITLVKIHALYKHGGCLVDITLGEAKSPSTVVMLPIRDSYQIQHC